MSNMNVTYHRSMVAVLSSETGHQKDCPFGAGLLLKRRRQGDGN